MGREPLKIKIGSWDSGGKIFPLCIFSQDTHCTGKTGKIALKITVRENLGNLEILPKHREFGLLRFPYSKGKRYFDICCQNSQNFLKLDKSAKSVLCMK